MIHLHETYASKLTYIMQNISNIYRKNRNNNTYYKIYAEKYISQKNISKAKYRLHESKIWKLKLTISITTRTINTLAVLSILYYTYWKDHTCRCVIYTNIRLFSGQFFLYKDKTEGCFGKSLDSVLIQWKEQKNLSIGIFIQYIWFVFFYIFSNRFNSNHWWGRSSNWSLWILINKWKNFLQMLYVNLFQRFYRW